MNESANAVNEYRRGLFAAVATSVLWGVLPIYWRWIECVDSWIIILYRIFLVGVFCFFTALKSYGLKGITEPLKQKGVLLRYFISGLVITVNWSIFIWAVNAGHVIETSIGYYMEPLVVSLFGVIIFGEKMNGLKKIAVALVIAAVAVMVVHFGQPPVIPLTLAVTFAVYAAVKKKFVMPPAISLFYETMCLMPFALAAIIYLEVTGRGALSMIESPHTYVLLLLCGAMTAIPMTAFAYAAARINLITLGISEYISPTISLIIGIFMFKEPFDIVQLAAIAIIWIGIVFFTAGEVREVKSMENAGASEKTESGVSAEGENR